MNKKVNSPSPIKSFENFPEVAFGTILKWKVDEVVTKTEKFELIKAFDIDNGRIFSVKAYFNAGEANFFKKYKVF